MKLGLQQCQANCLQAAKACRLLLHQSPNRRLPRFFLDQTCLYATTAASAAVLITAARRLVAVPRLRMGLGRVRRCAVGQADTPPRVSGVATAAQGDPELDQSGNRAHVDQLKRELLRLCAAGNRGLGASQDERERVIGLVEQLESSFKTQDVADRGSKLQGSWAVVYTTSPDLTSLDRLPLPFWRTGRIGQVFKIGGDANNEIDFLSPLGSRIAQTVRCLWADCGTLPDDSFKVKLTFVGSSTKLSKVAGIDVPLPSLAFPLPPAAGMFKVSFLDTELLIQRTRAGAQGVNVLVRESLETP